MIALAARDQVAISKGSHLICIVEDNDAMRSATTALVRSFGSEARAFSCAEHYLTASPRPCPTCLIIDIHMPTMSGLELQAALAESGDRTPIVFVTGYPDDELRSQALAAGAIAFLTKPFSCEELRYSIADALHAGRTAVHTEWLR